jgi:hypothetical protein
MPLQWPGGGSGSAGHRLPPRPHPLGRFRLLPAPRRLPASCRGPPPGARTPGTLRPSTNRAPSRPLSPRSILLRERKTMGECDTGWWSEGNDDLVGKLPLRPTGRWPRTGVVPEARLVGHKPNPLESCTDLPPSCCWPATEWAWMRGDARLVDPKGASGWKEPLPPQNTL